MNKTAIIGDIHGCVGALRRLLKEIPDDVTQLYSVGDLIDRGPDSKGVVQLCIDNNVKAVRGNHEDMFLDFLNSTEEYDQDHFASSPNRGDKTLQSYYDANLFQDNGGDKTLKSYITSHDEIEIPEEHLEYLESLPYFIETDNFILSHAGITHIRSTGDFGMGKWDDNSEKSNIDLMWNRYKLAVMNKIQIVGHNPVKEIEYIELFGELAGINIDTGCGKGRYKKLTALIMPTAEPIQVFCVEI